MAQEISVEETEMHGHIVPQVAGEEDIISHMGIDVGAMTTVDCPDDVVSSVLDPSGSGTSAIAHEYPYLPGITLHQTNGHGKNSFWDFLEDHRYAKQPPPSPPLFMKEYLKREMRENRMRIEEAEAAAAAAASASSSMLNARKPVPISEKERTATHLVEKKEKLAKKQQPSSSSASGSTAKKKGRSTNTGDKRIASPMHEPRASSSESSDLISGTLTSASPPLLQPPPTKKEARKPGKGFLKVKMAFGNSGGKGGASSSGNKKLGKKVASGKKLNNKGTKSPSASTSGVRSKAGTGRNGFGDTADDQGFIFYGIGKRKVRRRDRSGDNMKRGEHLSDGDVKKETGEDVKDKKEEGREKEDIEGNKKEDKKEVESRAKKEGSPKRMSHRRLEKGKENHVEEEEETKPQTQVIMKKKKETVGGKLDSLANSVSEPKKKGMGGKSKTSQGEDKYFNKSFGLISPENIVATKRRGSVDNAVEPAKTLPVPIPKKPRLRLQKR